MAKEDKVTNIADANKPKKVAQEDYDYIAKLRHQVSQYKNTYADLGIQQQAVLGGIAELNEKERIFSEQICEKYGISPGTPYTIDEDLNIIIRNPPAPNEGTGAE